MANGTITLEKKGTKQKRRMPKRMSKLGMWMMQNRGGIVVVIDRKAVEK